MSTKINIQTLPSKKIQNKSQRFWNTSHTQIKK
ncbi:Protein CBG27886 [Caenorhabditis briggsae]|uniref:Protein CBG27886 n=1 Tax=Caenorhabditis briggsae TaxID=6238 RepID=B6IEI1_CAEBR|nr:Protein CBG27886 [Caenorhabditis briggsae]CAR98311.1 Protein CBG27886 [Caenorhabditis briggsae]